MRDNKDDPHRVDELVSEARRIVQQQKGLIVRLRRAGADTSNAEMMLRFFEDNPRRLQAYGDVFKGED